MSRFIAASRRTVIVAIVAFAVAACGGATASPGATAVSATAPPASAPAQTSTTPAVPAPSLGEPPQATLAAEGGDPVSGALGSFTWGDGGSDSPWLPGSPITVATGEPLTVRLPAGIPVQDWTAKRAPAGTTDGVGATAIMDGGAAAIAFPAPGPGTWSVQVVVTFGDSLGSAAYYWAVTVR